MKYPQRSGDAGELQNFKDVGGKVYGFVQNNHSKINLSRLKAGSSGLLGGVTVIWSAVDPVSDELRVIGWYLNATVSEMPVKPAQKLGRSGYEYQFVAVARNAKLLPPSERTLKVPTKKKRTDRGYIGQHNWFFPLESNKYDSFLEAVAILMAGESPLSPDTSKVSGNSSDPTYIEGQKFLAEIKITARNPKLVARAKRELGLDCQVCNFNFKDAYGDIGDDFIEVHHIVPISKLGKTSTSLSDVNVVCANCHRMMHKNSPPFSVRELMARLRK